MRKQGFYRIKIKGVWIVAYWCKSRGQGEDDGFVSVFFNGISTDKIQEIDESPITFSEPDLELDYNAYLPFEKMIKGNK